MYCLNLLVVLFILHVKMTENCGHIFLAKFVIIHVATSRIIKRQFNKELLSNC